MEVSDPKRALLEMRLRGRVEPPPLASVAAHEPQEVPLSFAQERLWILSRLGLASAAYNVSRVVRVRGELDPDVVRRALVEVVRRHDALRTRVVERDGRCFQVATDHADISLSIADVSHLQADDRVREARRLASAAAATRFDLSRGPFVAASLVRLSHDDHVLALVLDHFVADGWSLAIVDEELATIYSAFAAGEPSPLPDLPARYADYALWEREALSRERLDRELGYWRDILDGSVDGIEIPTDRPRPQRLSQTGARVAAAVPGDILARVRSVARKRGATPFMVLLAALDVVLSRSTNQEDIVVGTVVANRSRPEFERVVGCFVNFLPLRVRVAAGLTFSELVDDVRATVLEAYAHDACPFDEIVQAVRPPRVLNRNPLYNVAFVLHSYRWSPPDEGLRRELFEIDFSGSLLDLKFTAVDLGHELRVECEYSADLFERETARVLLDAFCDAVATLVSNPEASVDSYELPVALAGRVRAPRARVAVAGSFTLDPLREPLQFWLNELGGEFEIAFAEYGQVFQELLSPDGLLRGDRTTAATLLLRIDDFGRHAPGGLGSEELERTVDELTAAVAAGSGSGPGLLVVVCPSAPGLARSKARAGLAERLEQRLVEGLRGLLGVSVATSRDIEARYPVPARHDERADALAHIPFTNAYYTAVATVVARHLDARRRPPIKLVVVDADNTLWDGGCAEDGAEGIRIGPERLAFQRLLLEQREAGRLLCVCSKNLATDVERVFETRTEMILRREDFTLARIGWEPKSDGIRAMAAELGVGLGNVLYLDDDPVECAEVERECPEVWTVRLPRDASALPQFLTHLWLLDTQAPTPEDRARADFYASEQARGEVRARAATLREFLDALDLHVDFADASGEELPRVAQLTARTNQFNTGGERSIAELRDWMRRGGSVVVARARDRFGDYGLVGTMLVADEGGAAVVDLFALSCRALGRRIEHRMLAHVAAAARARGLETVELRSRWTERNEPSRRFLESLAAGAVADGAARLSVARAFRAAELPDAPVDEPPATASGSPAPRVPLASPAGRYERIARELVSVDEIMRRLRSAPHDGAERTTAAVPPRTAVEEGVHAIWRDVLDRSDVGVEDDFFQIGGQSLLAVQIVARINEAFDVDLELEAIFERRTVATLAAAVEAEVLSQVLAFDG